ncbi:hypothetical protein [Ralstonia sp. GP101]|uniref:hypothetical protein n=1 Tax=Ralstonia sp. GP101 TaxID=3035146 RepID=UPI003892C705
MNAVVCRRAKRSRPTKPSASGAGSPDTLALTFARAEAEAMDTLAAHGYTRYGSVSLAAL